jgi:hypothetical protein
MPATTQTSLLELQTDVWKTRAQAKQKWLERTLAEPARTPQDAKRQTIWIKQALDAVKQGQHEIKYQTALLDVYASHLSALEMSLMAAAEERRGNDGVKSDNGVKSKEKK